MRLAVALFFYGFVVLKLIYTAYTYIIYLHGINCIRYSSHLGRADWQFVITRLPSGESRLLCDYLQANEAVSKLLKPKFGRR